MLKEKIKELRAMTHLGLTDCKKALEEANESIEEAIIYLQKKGLKKPDDLIIPLEGEVRASIYDNGNSASIVEVNCQTDFGAKSDLFKQFVISCGKSAQSDCKLNELTQLSNQLGEKVIIRRGQAFIKCESNNEYKVCYNVYNHLNGKIAVLLISEIKKNILNEEDIPFSDNKTNGLLDDIAMHIAATKPEYISHIQMPPAVLEEKRNMFLDEVKSKPEKIRENIVNGKLSKWYKEICLMNQDAVFDEQHTIQQLINNIDDKNIRITSFVRFERGEEIK